MAFPPIININHHHSIIAPATCFSMEIPDSFHVNSIRIIADIVKYHLGTQVIKNYNSDVISCVKKMSICYVTNSFIIFISVFQYNGFLCRPMYFVLCIKKVLQRRGPSRLHHIA